MINAFPNKMKQMYLGPWDTIRCFVLPTCSIFQEARKIAQLTLKTQNQPQKLTNCSVGQFIKLFTVAL